VRRKCWLRVDRRARRARRPDTEERGRHHVGLMLPPGCPFGLRSRGLVGRSWWRRAAHVKAETRRRPSTRAGVLAARA
jgi:hypothetical protein